MWPGDGLQGGPTVFYRDRRSRGRLAALIMCLRRRCGACVHAMQGLSVHPGQSATPGGPTRWLCAGTPGLHRRAFGSYLCHISCVPSCLQSRLFGSRAGKGRLHGGRPGVSALPHASSRRCRILTVISAMQVARGAIAFLPVVLGSHRILVVTHGGGKRVGGFECLTSTTNLHTDITCIARFVDIACVAL